MRRLFAGRVDRPVCIPLCLEHFETIQLRYHLESLRGERTQAAELNQELKLEVRACARPDASISSRGVSLA